MKEPLRSTEPYLSLFSVQQPAFKKPEKNMCIPGERLHGNMLTTRTMSPSSGQTGKGTHFQDTSMSAQSHTARSICWIFVSKSACSSVSVCIIQSGWLQQSRHAHLTELEAVTSELPAGFEVSFCHDPMNLGSWELMGLCLVCSTVGPMFTGIRIIFYNH